MGGLIQSAVVAAASSAVTFGIGEIFSSTANFYLKATYSALAHGTFQGGMSAVQGGKFWTGFAAGALSSIASSAWQGGSTFETVGDVTTETVHQGISGAVGMSNGFGTIAFGTIAGGAGSALTGGNFWQGAVTGLVVSTINHEIHGTPKKTYTSRQVKTNDNGEVVGEKLVYFKKGSYRGSDGKMHNDKLLYNKAMSEFVKTGVLSVYAHGYVYNLNHLTTVKDIGIMLGNDSTMWQNYKENGGSLTMDLKSCYVGYIGKGLNISMALTATNSGLTIYGAANFWLASGNVHNNAGYNKFYDGNKVDHVQNR